MNQGCTRMRCIREQQFVLCISACCVCLNGAGLLEASVQYATRGWGLCSLCLESRAVSGMRDTLRMYAPQRGRTRRHNSWQACLMVLGVVGLGVVPTQWWDLVSVDAFVRRKQVLGRSVDVYSR
eukprot:jgi/Ulvmu1/11227/UM072_0064.1